MTAKGLLDGLKDLHALLLEDMRAEAMAKRV